LIFEIRNWKFEIRNLKIAGGLLNKNPVVERLTNKFVFAVSRTSKCEQKEILLPINYPVMQTTVIIPAGGSSNRMGFNKLLAKLDNKPVLAFTIDQISKIEMVNEIILSVSEEIEKEIYEIIEKYNLKKVSNVVRGGKSRVESVWNALQVVEKSCDIVSVHDAARPFVSEDSFNKSIEAANSFGGSVVCTPITSTIKQTGTDFFVKKTIDRNNLWAAATPQSFKFKDFFETFEKTINSDIDLNSITDDAQIFELANKNVKIVEGNSENIKLTTPLDWKTAEIIMKDFNFKTG